MRRGRLSSSKRLGCHESLPKKDDLPDAMEKPGTAGIELGHGPRKLYTEPSGGSGLQRHEVAQRLRAT